MTETRSKTRRQIAASPPARDMRAQRTLRELHIDGTEALRSGKFDHKPTITRKCGGARYQVDDDGISWARSSAGERTTSAVAPSLPTPRRVCTRSQQEFGTFSTGLASKKRKRRDSTAAGKDVFLAEMLRQVKRVKVPKTTSRRSELRTMLPYLEQLNRPCCQHTRYHTSVANQQLGEATDAFDLDALAAKHLLRSDKRVEAPVFFPGSTTEFLDDQSNARAIEQILDWLPDVEERFDTSALEIRQIDANIPRKFVTVAEIRERFLEHNGYRQYPFNFPEIPFPAPVTPDIVQHPSCNLLNDITRYIQTIDITDICPSNCPNQGVTAENCPEHFLTPEEIVEFQQDYRHWLGTIMMAEAGALTPSHFDTFGFGTLITCYEGEIGFGWLNPNEEERTARDDKIKPSDRWRSRIMRLGDAVYMPPGTWHLVFRLPEGKQTLATAVRTLRYCDIVEWLRVLDMDMQNRFAEGIEHVEFGLVARGLVIGTRHLLDVAKAQKKLEKFGGQENVTLAEKLLSKIEEQLRQL